MNWIPFVAFLLQKMNAVAAAFVFALLYGSAVFSIVLSVKWALYRPVYAQLIMIVLIVILFLSIDTVGQSAT